HGAHLLKYWSLFDPWIFTWHAVHRWNLGSNRLCREVCSGAPRPVSPVPPPLWHSRHTVNTTGRFSSLAFIDPCAMWQVSQPSIRAGACSNTNGPRLSAWHFRQASSLVTACSAIRGRCAILHDGGGVPCGL